MGISWWQRAVPPPSLYPVPCQLSRNKTDIWTSRWAFSLMTMTSLIGGTASVVHAGSPSQLDFYEIHSTHSFIRSYPIGCCHSPWTDNWPTPGDPRLTNDLFVQHPSSHLDDTSCSWSGSKRWEFSTAFRNIFFKRNQFLLKNISVYLTYSIP